jgi:putative ribosome biogenesis GTPase RsgA
MESATKCVASALSKNYEAPNRKIDKLPILTRPNQERLNQILESPNSSINLFAGPSHSGKSTLTASLLNGRTATIFFGVVTVSY